MKVRLIDSLHGRQRRHRLGSLRAIPTSPRDAARAALTQALDPVYEMFGRLKRAGTGQISLYDSRRLEERYHALLDRVEAHFDALDAADTDAKLATWSRQADALASELGAWHAEVGSLIGYEESSRALKFGLLAVGGLIFLGGAAWVVVAKSKQKGRRR